MKILILQMLLVKKEAEEFMRLFFLFQISNQLNDIKSSLWFPGFEKEEELKLEKTEQKINVDSTVYI